MLNNFQVNYDLPLGAGNERRVLNHPAEAARAIKIFVERRPEMKAYGVRGWAIRNMISVRNRRQRRELECFLDLHIQGKTADPELPIARITGFCSTNFGPAIEVEKIDRSPADPSVGRTLNWLLEKPELRVKMPAALNDLMDRLERFDIFICDANARNIMLKNVGGSSVLVMVDGFGDYRTIRFLSHSKWMISRSIRQSFFRHVDEWDLAWDTKRGRFAL